VPKIFVRQTADRITSAFDDANLLCLNNLHVGNSITNNHDIMALLVILNSSLLTWYYRKISLEEGRTMAQTDIESLEKLPIKYDQKVWNILEFICNLLNDLKNGEIFDYIDKFIANSLIYELYFSKQLKR
jgi:hypothetical protein